MAGNEALKDGPSTFEALLGQNGTGLKPLPVCSRCGKPATHKLSLTVTKPSPGNGRGHSNTVITRHGNHLCEPCAVAVFAKFREIIR